MKVGEQSATEDRNKIPRRQGQRRTQRLGEVAVKTQVEGEIKQIKDPSMNRLNSLDSQRLRPRRKCLGRQCWRGGRKVFVQFTRSECRVMEPIGRVCDRFIRQSRNGRTVTEFN